MKPLKYDIILYKCVKIDTLIQITRPGEHDNCLLN